MPAAKDANSLGDVHKGFEVANEWLSSTPAVAASAVGRAERAFELTLPFTAERKLIWPADQQVSGGRFQLADMVTRN